MDYLLHVDDSLVIAMVQISLNLRYSRLSWMLILCFDFIPCCLLLCLYHVLKLFPSVGTDVVKHYNTVGVHRSFPQEVAS